MIGKLFLCFWILRWTCLLGDFAVAQRRSMGLDESLDERNDAEIFRAVVESMRQWTLLKKLHHRAKREVSKVCYEDVGCFEDTGPFSYLEMLPSPPRDVGTRFLVYGSRKARSIPMEVPADDINDNAHRAIDPDLPTKVIVHGFGSSCDHVWVYEMRSALMTVHECNIVCVDWGPGSAVPNYVRAAANTRLVGRQLAKLIRSLNVPLEKVHLIGFSLGAHVAGFAGAELGNVSRITGLDPAGPLFESQDPRARLDETDANFVDVIHSNGEQLLLGGLGSWQPMGDVDFYPNGGRMQTGCSNLFLGAVSDIIWSSAVEGRSLCNHRRAYKLFTDSVSPKCRFPAFSCHNGYDGLLKGECFPCSVNGVGRPCGDMGYYSDESPARGQLYLVTRDEEPFCAHQYQVKVYNSRSERPTRSYGKLQVSLVGEAAFNETFAMTRKDEELLVGAVLQKIVVPHPAITNVDAIEIKYTAYSGWISSGLVSWSIDKVAIIDSFGKTLSMCRKGLILESGHPVFLPLYPGDCSIPQDNDNSTAPSAERLPDSRMGGIGPFTKEQNYEQAKDVYKVDFSGERTPQKGIGPFTKNHNIRIIDGKDSYKTTEYKFDELDDRRSDSNPWTILDISGDGDSNSLENSGSETGRGFSGSNHIQSSGQRPSSAGKTATESTTEDLPEIREPVLRLGKKETGRSLRFPEITEPILRPRATRQNAKGDVSSQEKRKDENQDASSSTSRSFTVQFLPERLAGILAQAERYARQTLLPLISQYTPSFVGGVRFEEPKYFPPLGDLDTDDTRDVIPTREVKNAPGSKVGDRESETRIYDFGIHQEDMQSASTEQIAIADSSHAESTTVDLPTVSKTSTSNLDSSASEGDQWIPIESKLVVPTVNVGSRKEFNASRSLDWNLNSNDSDYRNLPVQIRVSDKGTTGKVDDWVPITDKPAASSTPEAQTENVSTVSSAGDEESSKKQPTTSPENEEIETTSRKFIPLIEFDDPSGFFPATNTVLERRSSTVSFSSHIQKIPRKLAKTTTRTTRRSMVFPYAYERRKDPSTRYIPLIPEEDLGRSRASFDRFR